MLPTGTLYATAVLMALVAAVCTALCLAWTNPAWRRRLAPAPAGGRVGWPARVGSGLVSAGVAACALLAWYGVYCTLYAV